MISFWTDIKTSRKCTLTTANSATIENVLAMINFKFHIYKTLFLILLAFLFRQYVE